MSAFAVGLFQNGKKKNKNPWSRQSLMSVCHSSLKLDWLMRWQQTVLPAPASNWSVISQRRKKISARQALLTVLASQAWTDRQQVSGMWLFQLFFFFFLSSGDHTGGRRQSCYFAVKVLSPKFPLLFDSIRHSHVIEPTQSHGLSVF